MDSQSHNKPLYEILSLRSSLLEQVMEEASENEGLIEEELDKLWQNNEVELAEKLDSYGFTIKNLESEITRLSGIKKELNESIHKAEDRLEKAIEKIKCRLNYYSENKPLKGSIFSFYPFTSTRGQITKLDLLSPEETYLTVEIKGSEWDKIKSDKFEARIVKITGKISELPPNHPAVEYSVKPSVKIRS